MRRRRVGPIRLCLVAIALGGGGGCAPRHLRLPEGSGTPLPDFATIFNQATSTCRDVRTLTAELRLSGRAAGQRLGGRVLAGLAAPSLLRLEGVAPFGPPAFILTANAGGATLLLPRDHRVLTGEPAAAILEALTGVSITPGDLRGLLAGCVVSDPQAVAGRSYGDWTAVDLAGGATAYLKRQNGAWRVLAGLEDGLRIEYDKVTGSPARIIRLFSHSDASGATDLTVKLSQVEMNVDIPSGAFEVSVPADADPLSLDELRQVGPLGRAAASPRL